jgi:hypothetical protein
MFWIVVLAVILFSPLIWAMVSRWRRGEREDEVYGGSSSDPALMEIGRQHHGSMR